MSTIEEENGELAKDSLETEALGRGKASSNKTGEKHCIERLLKMVRMFVFYLCDLSSCIALFLLYFIIFLLYFCIVKKEKEVSSSVESNQPSRSNKKTATPKSPKTPQVLLLFNQVNDIFLSTILRY